MTLKFRSVSPRLMLSHGVVGPVPRAGGIVALAADLVQDALEAGDDGLDLVQELGQGLEGGDEVVHAAGDLGDLVGDPGADLGGDRGGGQAKTSSRTDWKNMPMASAIRSRTMSWTTWTRVAATPRPEEMPSARDDRDSRAPVRTCPWERQASAAPTPAMVPWAHEPWPMASDRSEILTQTRTRPERRRILPRRHQRVVPRRHQRVLAHDQPPPSVTA